MLADAGIERVDIFVLDVEGSEFMVLQTMDWSIPVGVFVVEMSHNDNDRMVKKLLYRKGYYKSKWKIDHYCPAETGCARNEVFERAHLSSER